MPLAKSLFSIQNQLLGSKPLAISIMKEEPFSQAKHIEDHSPTLTDLIHITEIEDLGLI